MQICSKRILGPMPLAPSGVVCHMLQEMHNCSHVAVQHSHVNCPKGGYSLLQDLSALREGGNTSGKCGPAKLGAVTVLTIVKLASMKMEKVSGEKLKAGRINMKQLH